MNLGICGGTFDPFHRGHLDPVLAVRATMHWDRILYMPAFMQPFKQDRQSASPYHRFAMVAAATIDHPFIDVSPMELERGQVSFTVDTLEELRAGCPDDTLDWIIGDDNLSQLLAWRSVDRILQLANFTVLMRDDTDVARARQKLPQELQGLVREPQARPANGAISFAPNATVAVSSTEVRRRVREGQSFDELVPGPVSRYIQHYGLYRSKGQL